MKKNWTGLFIMALTGVVMWGCGGSNGAYERRLTVGIEPLRYMAEQIAGDKWTVGTLLDKGSSAESFDPSISAMRRLNDSEVYFAAGHLPFERALTRYIDTSRVDYVDTSAGIRLIAYDGEYGCDEYDPHTWISVNNARVMAGNIASALMARDYENADYYRDRLERFTAMLDSIDTEIKERISASDDSVFVVWHPTLSYFARDYGLRQIALSAENKDLSATTLRGRIDGARKAGARVFLTQPELDSERAWDIAAQTGAKKADIHPMSYDWKGEMLRLSEAIAGSGQSNKDAQNNK